MEAPTTDIIMVPHRYVGVAARGQACGEAASRCRWSDAVVAEARRLAALGALQREIGIMLSVPRMTVQSWLQGRRRKAPVAYRLRPVRGISNGPL